MKIKQFFIRTLVVVLLTIPLHSKAVVVFFNYSVFKAEQGKSYVELYFKIPISTVRLVKNSNGKYIASLLLEIKYSRGDSIDYQNQFILDSPELADTNNPDYAMLDLKRNNLNYGYYRLDVKITDQNNPSNQTSFAYMISTRFNDIAMAFSDIEFADTIKKTMLLNKFSRNHYDVFPNVFNIYKASNNFLFFYTEFYNTSHFLKEDILYIKYYLSFDSLVFDSTIKITRQKADTINYLNGTINMAEMKEGRYLLHVEVYDGKNHLLLSKATPFSINDNLFADQIKTNYDIAISFNKMTKDYSKQQSREYLDYIYSISDQDELTKSKALAGSEDSNAMVNFLLRFWEKRNPEDPARAWNNFLVRIEECNKLFTTPLRKGYLTDRGRVYMDYGPPNSVVEAVDPSIAYPYQIWHYYSLTPSQKNKKFVFFNKTGAMNEYELLHSNANGEPHNEAWQTIIKKYNQGPNRNSKVFGDFLDDDFKE
jgi:GWxTD domain-containing protein